jgi:hypothetical protein
MRLRSHGFAGFGELESISSFMAATCKKMDEPF